MGNKLEETVGLEDGAGKPEACSLDPSSSVCLESGLQEEVGHMVGDFA